jgi:hypothetical protein
VGTGASRDAPQSICRRFVGVFCTGDAAMSVQTPFLAGVSSQGASGVSTVPVRVTRELPFRIIPRIETYPRLVSFCQTVPGQAALLATFGLIYALFNPNSLPLVLCLALLTWIPGRRNQLISISTLFFAILVPWHTLPQPLYHAELVLACIALGWLLMWCRAKWPQSWYGQNSAEILIAGFGLWIAAISLIPWHFFHAVTLWDISIVFGSYVWYVAYILIDRVRAPLSEFGFETGTLRPFWGSLYTPFPNGSAYLKHIEAKNPEHLAITQLKGLKLLAWSTLILLFSKLFLQFFHGYLGVPNFTMAVSLSAHRAPLPWFVCWASLIVYFLEKVMSGAILGHRIIACCRMAGFDALRNMYRPLSSVTVAEFFNRYYYYYKELLVTFFFLPAFLKQPSLRPKLRLALAIFVAACLGNSFFHFTRELLFIHDAGLWTALRSFQSFFFYSLVLAIALIVSRLRKRGPAPSGFFRGTLCPAVFVCFFFCLLSIFAVTDYRFPLIENLRFLGHLFFIG